MNTRTSQLATATALLLCLSLAALAQQQNVNPDGPVVLPLSMPSCI